MSAPHTAETGITLMPIRNAVAEEIEQLARDQHADVSDVLNAALKAWKSAHTPEDVSVKNAARSAYDQWFRAQVQAALNDSRPAIPNEQVKAHFARRRDFLLQESQTQAER